MREDNRFERELAALLEYDLGNGNQSDFFFENEIDPQFGLTRYLPIRLSPKVLPKVGVFMPPGFSPAAAINVIVYFHGHIAPCLCPSNAEELRKFNKDGIEYYWNTPCFTFLREELSLSGRNALLIAPTFTSKINRDPQSYGNLNESGKFDFLIRECLKHLKNENLLPGHADVQNIILAGHSAGGLPMQSILRAKNSLGPNIVECWGFESLYFGTDIWQNWLKSNANKSFIHYRRAQTFADATKALKARTNFRDLNDGRRHCSIVKQKWRTSLEKCRWIQSGTSGDPVSREFSEMLDTAGVDHEFSLAQASLYTGKIILAAWPKNDRERNEAKKKNGAFVEIKESPSVFILEIIRRARDYAIKEGKKDLAAKLNHTNWFNQFTRDFTFLGRKMKERQFVHLELAKLLKNIEVYFIKELGLSDAGTAGNILLKNSDERLVGSRLTSSTATFSMHLFGLAVDINYLGNPYIESENDKKGINNVLKNAAALMNTEPLTYRKHVKIKLADRYDYLQTLDGTIENYFKLLDEAPVLERYLQATKSSDWRGLSINKAQEKIQKNLDNLAKLLGRVDDPSGKKRADFKKDYFKKHAILNFDKRFIVGMEKMGLHWGGYYGDMMHFDLRNTGVGYYIAKARTKYNEEVKNQAARLLKEKKYGEYSPL